MSATFLFYARATELPEICIELREFLDELQCEQDFFCFFGILSTTRSLKLASDGGYQLFDTEKIDAEKQICTAVGPACIDIDHARLLVQLVVSEISNYPPGGDDITFIPSAEPLTPYLTSARTSLCPPIIARRIPLIPLLKLTTYHMAA